MEEGQTSEVYAHCLACRAKSQRVILKPWIVFLVDFRSLGALLLPWVLHSIPLCLRSNVGPAFGLSLDQLADARRNDVDRG